MTSTTEAPSAAFDRRARQLTPGGVHSNVRMAGPRVCFERGEGAWLYDVDGNDYVDYLLGQGPALLGHASPVVNDAVAREMRRGSVFGSQHVLENEAAELFLDTVGWADKVRFGVTGTEADQAALRLARAATGRTKFVRFEGTYHGWLDDMLVSGDSGRPQPGSDGQVGNRLGETYFVPYNDVAAVEDLFARHDDIAAVLVEPVMCNSGAIQPRDGFLADLRRLCDQHGAVLIFDEVITGFRMALGGAAEKYGVTPDLAVYGKAMAGGWPVSALAGTDAVMDLLTSGVVHSGTFNSSVAACAAVVATLTELRANPPYERIDAHGTVLMERIRALADKHGLPLRVQGLPVAFHVSFGEPGPVFDHAGMGGFDTARYAAFAHRLVRHGVWVAPRGIWYVSGTHGERELAAVTERLDSALDAEARLDRSTIS